MPFWFLVATPTLVLETSKMFGPRGAPELLWTDVMRVPWPLRHLQNIFSPCTLASVAWKKPCSRPRFRFPPLKCFPFHLQMNPQRKMLKFENSNPFFLIKFQFQCYQDWLSRRSMTNRGAKSQKSRQVAWGVKGSRYRKTLINRRENPCNWVEADRV